MNSSFVLEYRHFPNEKVSLQLTEFSLYESSCGLIVDDIKCILNFIPNLNQLTLSIRDTHDHLFTHGPTFESILNQSLPNLRQFNYTMTHLITEKTVVEDFVRWPMNFVKDEDRKYLHIYSLPWPSSKDDRRKFLFLEDQSDGKISPYVKDIIITKSEQFFELEKYYPRVRRLRTSLPIEIKLPQRISKLILNEETSKDSFFIQFNEMSFR